VNREFDPPATFLGERFGDGTFRPVVMPSGLADLPVVAARSSGDGFLVAVRDEAGTVWVVHVGADRAVDTLGQVAAATEVPYRAGAAGVLDASGNFSYVVDHALFYGSFDDPTMSWEQPRWFDELRAYAVITGP
jgi:hypothetical protein